MLIMIEIVILNFILLHFNILLQLYNLDSDLRVTFTFNNVMIRWFICKFRGLFTLFLMAYVRNLPQHLFITADVSNLDACLGGSLVYFHTDWGG